MGRKSKRFIDVINTALNKTIKGFPSTQSLEALNKIFLDADGNSLFLSIGGGPGRANPKLINLNIGNFANVDIVGDAYHLPFVDNSVSGIYCGAVLEHLEFPEIAVREMNRVLKKGGMIYSDTPFLQPYHGYPNHFQNFTLTGHERLYLRNNFSIISSGVCVGSTYVIGELVLKYILSLKPSILFKPLSKLFILLIAPFRSIDKTHNKRDFAFELASTTFVLAQK